MFIHTKMRWYNKTDAKSQNDRSIWLFTRKQKKKQQIMQPTITGNSLWESHQHTTIVKMDGSFTFCPLEEEEKKQRRTKNMQWNLQRKTNKCQNNRSRFFQWGSWTLQCIDDRAKAMSDWLTEWCYIYMCFFFFLFVFMSNFENYRMTKSNQMDAHFTFMFPFSSRWFIGTVASSLTSTIVYSLSHSWLWMSRRRIHLQQQWPVNRYSENWSVATSI